LCELSPCPPRARKGRWCGEAHAITRCPSHSCKGVRPVLVFKFETGKAAELAAPPPDAAESSGATPEAEGQTNSAEAEGSIFVSCGADDSWARGRAAKSTERGEGGHFLIPSARLHVPRARMGAHRTRTRRRANEIELTATHECRAAPPRPAAIPTTPRWQQLQSSTTRAVSP